MPGNDKQAPSASMRSNRKDKSQQNMNKMVRTDKQVLSKMKNEKVQHAKGFYAFLKDGKYMKDTLLSKTQLKNIYSMLYSPQFHPNIMPDFESLMSVMQSSKMIKLASDDRITFLPHEDQSSKKKQQPAPKKDQSKPPPKGRGAIHLAVDQRVALGSGMWFRETTQKTELQCAICKVTLSSMEESETHRAGNVHRSNFLIHWYNNNRKTLIQKKNNVHITAVAPDDCKFIEEEGLITLKAKPNEKKIIELRMENKGEKPIVVRHIEMLCHNTTFQLQDEYGVTSGNKFVKIPAGLNYSLQIHCQNGFVGQYQAPIAFQMRKEDNSELFHILRDVILYVQFSGLEDLLPKAPFKSPHPVALWPEHKDTVPGLEMPRRTGNALKKLIKLDNYWSPPKLNRLLNHGLKTFKGINEEENVMLQNTMKLLADGLTPDNYSQYISLLLHVEEHQMNVDIHHYDIEDVTMKRDPENKQLLALEVPGLAEKRPSVLRGDKLFVVIKDQTEKSKVSVQYEGIVHFVRENEVVLGFSQILRDKYLPNMKFDVHFTFNRYPIQNQHRAVFMAAELSLHKLMFPSAASASTCLPLCDSSADFLPMNRMLQSNKEQKQAVRHIVAGSSRPAPYLVFGPPGTGKTMTVVEAMKQIWRKFPKAHILACAPSNSASDLLAERLRQHVPKSDINRLYASCHQWQQVPECLKDCCNYDPQQKHFVFPSKEALMKYRIIITTLVTAGRLVSANFPQNHFTHVFIDECGHAIEAEAMIAVAGILETTTGKEMGGQLVMAGDPKQLGPVLRSPIVLKHGLDKSLLERLMLSDLYQKDASTNNYNPLVLTKLLKNFRSHEAILNIPNTCFYEDELEEAGDPLLTSVLCDWDVLPKRGFPMLFHAVIGKDQREQRSPSFFNMEEIMVVQYYVDELLQARVRGTRIQQKEIGIISPYRRQVQKLQQMFRKKNWTEVTVGSTEQFQGQERKVIIISTVRSNPDMLALDNQYKLGFLRNPKRFNVAITRAKALLIVIGNPHILCRDHYWRTLINYCSENGGVTGSRFNMDSIDRDVDDITQHFKTVSLGPTSDEVEVSKKELYEGPQWRSEI